MQEELHRKSVEVRMTIRIMSSPQATKLMVAEKWTATSCCCAYVSRKGAGLSFTASKVSSIPNVSAPPQLYVTLNRNSKNPAKGYTDFGVLVDLHACFRAKEPTTSLNFRKLVRISVSNLLQDLRGCDAKLGR